MPRKSPASGTPPINYRLGYIEPRLLEISFHNTFLSALPLSQLADYRRMARTQGNLVDRPAKGFNHIQTHGAIKLRR